MCGKWRWKLGLTKAVWEFQADEDQQRNLGSVTAAPCLTTWVFLYGFGISEPLHLSLILDMEKIADNGNENNSKQLERPSSNHALSTALQSV